MLRRLADTLSLKALLDELKTFGWEHVDHWSQGEFHHDVVIRLRDRPPELPGEILVVSTTCNGAVKELLCLDEIPDRWGLWHFRCPDNPEFRGPRPHVREVARTVHWVDPKELLGSETRSEYRAEFRRRQRGGGYVSIDSVEE